MARLTLFEDAGDYHAFERVIEEAHQRVPLRILDLVVMPNHWHFVVWPQTDEEVSEFFQWMTVTHSMRWHAHHNTSGTGHLYQGRFKSFPVQDDEHLFRVLRYVQRNPVRANLSTRAEDWRWGSAWRRRFGTSAQQTVLAAGPLRRPRKWLDLVNTPQTEAELELLRRSAQRGAPFGSDTWMKNSAVWLGLQSTLRPRGRPHKAV